MPLYFSSFFLPASQGIPFLMEDVYIRGGYRCVANIAARDAIGVGARKAGMRVYVQDVGETYTVNTGALTTWVLVSTKSQRASGQFVAGSSIAPAGFLDFTLNTGLSSIIQALSVSHADLKIEAHSTPARADSNPYTFVSYAGHLSDDGSSKLQDSSIEFGRRYALLINNEGTPIATTYWRVTNNGAGAVTPTINASWLPLE